MKKFFLFFVIFCGLCGFLSAKPYEMNNVYTYKNISYRISLPECAYRYLKELASVNDGQMIEGSYIDYEWLQEQSGKVPQDMIDTFLKYYKKMNFSKLRKLFIKYDDNFRFMSEKDYFPNVVVPNAFVKVLKEFSEITSLKNHISTRSQLYESKIYSRLEDAERFDTAIAEYLGCDKEKKFFITAQFCENSAFSTPDYMTVYPMARTFAHEITHNYTAIKIPNMTEAKTEALSRLVFNTINDEYYLCGYDVSDDDEKFALSLKGRFAK